VDSLIGYLAVMGSAEKENKIPPHKVKRLLGESAESRGDYKNALHLYKESLFHLENDYKGLVLPKHTEEKRHIYMGQIMEMIKKLEENIS
jgi:hypothetical protein